MSKLINPIEEIHQDEVASTLASNIRDQLTLPPEERTYLLLIVNIDQEDDSTYTSFDFLTGRTTVYEFVRDIVKNEEPVDLDDSLVMANGCTFEQSIPFKKFLQIMKERYYQNDDFDIDEYI